MLGSIDDISGAKRKENLTNHAGDARMSGELATIQVDVPVEIDVGSCAAQEPDRSQIRETFRIFKLRDPLRRLEEALGEDDAAPPAASSWPSRYAACRAGLSQLGDERPALAAERPVQEPRAGGLLPAQPETAPLRFAAHAGGGDVFVGRPDRSPRSRWAGATGRSSRMTGSRSPRPRSRARCPRSSTTRRWPPTCSTAGRAYPLDKLLGDEGIGISVKNADGLAERAVGTRALAERQVTRIGEGSGSPGCCRRWSCRSSTC